MIPSRRAFLAGLAASVAMPGVPRAAIEPPVRVIVARPRYVRLYPHQQDALRFVDTHYVPGLFEQSQSRMHRIGARPAIVHVMPLEQSSLQNLIRRKREPLQATIIDESHHYRRRA